MAAATTTASTTAAAILPFSEEEFLCLGFEALGDNTWHRSMRVYQLERYRSLYGTSPRILSIIWDDLRNTSHADGQLDPLTKPLHLLFLYKWLKSYESKNELKTAFGGVAVKTIRKWKNHLLFKVAYLRKTKIDPSWNENDKGLIRGRTVDAIHYPIDEPRPFSTKYSSHKFGGKAGLSYEYCIKTDKNQICWLNGPFPAAVADITILQEKGLQKAISTLQEDFPELRVIADDGYFKIEFVSTLSYRNEFDPREVAYFKDRALSRHESFNGRTKRFGCLTEKFRHDHTSGNPNFAHPNHKACVEAICVTIQYELDTGETTLLDPYPS